MLARRNGLDWAFVAGPLNGLDRREFRTCYLGLSSKINTYLDAFPGDVEANLRLYRGVYNRVKAEAPDTQVFVAFQWDDLDMESMGGAFARSGRSRWDIQSLGPFAHEESRTINETPKRALELWDRYRGMDEDRKE